MIRWLHVEIARPLEAGLNGDADQRAATSLLIGAGHGVWMDKLRGWPEYVRPVEDPRRRWAVSGLAGGGADEEARTGCGGNPTQCSQRSQRDAGGSMPALVMSGVMPMLDL